MYFGRSGEEFGDDCFVHFNRSLSHNISDRFYFFFKILKLLIYHWTKYSLYLRVLEYKTISRPCELQLQEIEQKTTEKMLSSLIDLKNVTFLHFLSMSYYVWKCQLVVVDERPWLLHRMHTQQIISFPLRKLPKGVITVKYLSQLAKFSKYDKYAVFR